MEIENEIKKESKQADKSKSKPTEVFRKIDGQSLKLLNSLRERANKKNYGKTIKDSELIGLGLSLITDVMIKDLQEKSLSNRDRLNLWHEQYCKKSEKISFDQFLGQIMQSENLNFKDQSS